MEELERKPTPASAVCDEDRAMSLLVHAQTILDDEISDKTIAVDCLVKASQLGNEEAANLLAKCWDKNIGINEGNRQEVMISLKESKEQSRLKCAVEKLFGTLKKEGQEKIRSEDIKEALERAKEEIQVR